MNSEQQKVILEKCFDIMTELKFYVYPSFNTSNVLSYEIPFEITLEKMNIVKKLLEGIIL